MLQVLDLCRWEDLDSYRAAWDALCDRSGERNPWASLHWLQAMHESYAGSRCPRALLAFDGRQLVGVVPLLGEKTGDAWSWRTLNPPGGSAAPAGAQPTATLCSVFDYLARCDSTWSSVVWSHVARGSGLLARLRSSALHSRLPLAERAGRVLASVDLQAGSEAYWNGLPSGLRNSLARQFAVLSAQQRLSFEFIAGAQAAVAMPESDPVAQSLLRNAAPGRTPVAATLHLDGRLVASAWGVELAGRELVCGFTCDVPSGADLGAIFWRQWIAHSLDAGVHAVQGDAAWPGLAGFAQQQTEETAVHLRGPACAHDGWWGRLRAWVGDLREANPAPAGSDSRSEWAGAARGLSQREANPAPQRDLKVVAHDDLLDALSAPATPREHVGRPQLALWNQAAAEQAVEG